MLGWCESHSIAPRKAWMDGFHVLSQTREKVMEREERVENGGGGGGGEHS